MTDQIVVLELRDTGPERKAVTRWPWTAAR